MKAEYISSVSHAGNPFIEALPPVLGGQELINALAYHPPYDESMCHLPSEIRLQLLGNLYEVYQPLQMTIALYYQTYTAMQHSFSQKMTIADVGEYHRNYADMQNRRITASTGGGNSFSVIGVSGLGKSSALQQVLALFPPVIEHKQYNEKSLICKQIPYITVQTPHDGSIKALCLDLMLQVDEMCGTTHYKRALSNKLTGDMLVSQISNITKNINLGLLVIDELQNISFAKSGGGVRLLNFLVQLINSAHLSICMVGTPQVLSVLQTEFRSARRATGLVYDRLQNNGEFALLLETLWRYQFTQKKAKLTAEMRNWIYRKTQGIPDILVKLLYQSQQRAIMDGTETISINILERAYKDSMQIVDGFLAGLDTASKRRTASPKPQSGDICIDVKNALQGQNQGRGGVDLRTLVEDAKRQGVGVTDALKEYITEIAI